MLDATDTPDRGQDATPDARASDLGRPSASDSLAAQQRALRRARTARFEDEMLVPPAGLGADNVEGPPDDRAPAWGQRCPPRKTPACAPTPPPP